jgi:hypothetical protein
MFAQIGAAGEGGVFRARDPRMGREALFMKTRET